MVFRCNAVDPFFRFTIETSKFLAKTVAQRRMGSGMIGMRTGVFGRCHREREGNFFVGNEETS